MQLAEKFATTLILTALVLIGMAFSAQAKTRALLVGVSNYYYLDPQYDLKGPRNDVREFARLLIEKGLLEEDIVVLTDPDATLAGGIIPHAPTKSAILMALDELAKNTEKDDRVIFIFPATARNSPTWMVTSWRGWMKYFFQPMSEVGTTVLALSKMPFLMMNCV